MSNPDFGTFDFDAHYMNHEKWEQAWINNETDWWPDSIKLPSSVQVIREGCPSSAMPEAAQTRIQLLRDNGDKYVTHVDTGVHAYRIGFYREYFPSFDQLFQELGECTAVMVDNELCFPIDEQDSNEYGIDTELVCFNIDGDKPYRTTCNSDGSYTIWVNDIEYYKITPLYPKQK